MLIYCIPVVLLVCSAQAYSTVYLLWLMDETAGKQVDWGFFNIINPILKTTNHHSLTPTKPLTNCYYLLEFRLNLREDKWCLHGSIQGKKKSSTSDLPAVIPCFLYLSNNVLSLCVSAGLFYSSSRSFSHWFQGKLSPELVKWPQLKQGRASW